MMKNKDTYEVSGPKRYVVLLKTQDHHGRINERKDKVYKKSSLEERKLEIIG